MIKNQRERQPGNLLCLTSTHKVLTQVLQIELEIQAALEDASGLTWLDVHSLNDAPLNAQGEILGESILLYCLDDDHRVAFEVNTRKRYFDFQPLAARLRQRILAHIRGKGLRYGQTRNR